MIKTKLIVNDIFALKSKIVSSGDKKGILAINIP